MDDRVRLRIGPIPHTNGGYIHVLHPIRLDFRVSTGPLLARSVAELKKGIEERAAAPTRQSE